MNKTTATHKVEWEWEITYAQMVAKATAIKEDAAIMGRELTEQEREFIEMVDKAVVLYDEEGLGIPTGWLCPRCGAVNAPDVKRCGCKPENFELPPTENYFHPLPHTVVGPKETK